MINVNRVFGHVCHFQLLHDTEEMVLFWCGLEKGQGGGIMSIYSSDLRFHAQAVYIRKLPAATTLKFNWRWNEKEKERRSQQGPSGPSEWSDFEEALRSTGGEEASRDIDENHLYMNFTTKNDNAVKNQKDKINKILNVYLGMHHMTVTMHLHVRHWGRLTVCPRGRHQPLESNRQHE